MEVELTSTYKKINSKEAYFLNSMFFEEIGKRPFWLIVKEMPEAPTKIISETQTVKVYLGRQLGEVIFKSDFDERVKSKVNNSGFKKAMDSINRNLRIYDDLAKKYFYLSQTAYFEQYRNETISQYWLRRTGIDLKQYKELLALMPNKKGKKHA